MIASRGTAHGLVRRLTRSPLLHFALLGACIEHEHGIIDKVVPRHPLREALSRLIAYLAPETAAA